MKKNIALFGTFDVENYGDLMFPEIFDAAMAKRSEDYKLFLFSPIAEKRTTPDGTRTVYPAGEIEAVDREYGLDAVIIGGGALVHYSEIPVILSKGTFESYRIIYSWLKPVQYAAEHNIKIIFNAPQVPYPVCDALTALTTSAFDAVDYISFRDEMSKRFIADAYAKQGKAVPEISVLPDTVCCIAELYEKERLLQSIKGFELPESYAVLQFNPQKPEIDDKALNEAVDALTAKGYGVVLLPLGYTHNDSTVLHGFNEKFGSKCIEFPRKLGIFEQAAVLAGCKIYIGASFHGAITAISFGNTAISYNYIIPREKNKEIFKQYGVSGFVADSAADIVLILKRYFDGEGFTPDIKGVNAQVNAHFDKTAALIAAPAKTGSACFAVNESLYGLPMKLVDNDVLIASLKAQASQANGQMLAQKEISDRLSEQNTIMNANYTALSNAYSQLEAVYNGITHSFFWKITLPLRRFTDLAKKIVRHIPVLRTLLKGCKLLLTPAGRYRLKAHFKRRRHIDYNGWSISKNQRTAEEQAVFEGSVKFSILVPLYNTPQDFLKQMAESVLNQTYKNWELCLADGSDDAHKYVSDYCRQLQSGDKRIKYTKLTENKGISENTNACLSMATGDYIALFDHDDCLHPSALYEYAKAIEEKNADFIYCDEDKFNDYKGKLYDFYFKPDFAVDNLRANNYICHFTVFKKDLLDEVGLFRSAFDGSQDHDLVLRLTEKAQSIVHIPKLLYHWRVSKASVASDPYAKPYTIKAGINAVSEHLQRCKLDATVESSTVHPNIYRIRYRLKATPLVSILIPSNNHIDDLSRCIQSILNKTTYRNYEIIIIENNSNKATFDYYKTLEQYDNIRVVVYPSGLPFNYSSLNNFGVKYANGEHYILLNNDIEIITPGWIEELLMYSQRSDVGAVGAMLYYPDNTIQHAGVIIGLLTLAGHAFRHAPRGTAGYFGRAAYQQNVSAVTAACIMIPRSVYNEIDGLDEKFQVAFNDIDLCMRIRKAGYLIVFTPYAEMYHYESKSRGVEDTPAKRARFEGEVKRFRERWAKELEAGDPYYNPNLTLDAEDFGYRSL